MTRLLVLSTGLGVLTRLPPKLLGGTVPRLTGAAVGLLYRVQAVPTSASNVITQKGQQFRMADFGWRIRGARPGATLKPCPERRRKVALGVSS
jgi:hypothetical protein